MGIAEEVELQDGKRVYRYEDDFYTADFDVDAPENKGAEWKFLEFGSHAKMKNTEGFTFDVFTSPIDAFNRNNAVNILGDVLDYGTLSQFISTYLPGYHTRSDVLETDLLWRYIGDEGLDDDDYSRMKQKHPSKSSAIERLIELEAGFCEESLRVFYSKFFKSTLEKERGRS